MATMTELWSSSLAAGQAPPGQARQGLGTAGEVGGADQARVRAEPGDPDLGQRAVGTAGEAVGKREASRADQQVPGLGDAAADYEATRVENRGQVGQAGSEPVPDDLEAAQGHGVAFLGRAGNRRAVDALDAPAGQLEQPGGPAGRAPGEVTRLGDQGIPAHVLLPAAPVSAAAQPAVRYHPVVAGLAGGAPP